MIQSWRELGLETLMLRRESLRQPLKLSQMGRGITITKSVVSNEVQPLAQQLVEMGKLRIHRDLSTSKDAARRGCGW
ncbi:hypothetical protein SAMN02745166_03032 [Prosthecobacter debontii]|uniref:Uncharacterized protein n=1 Tax=Prosthecobacter debontii TaxID=48467 RepID=A0A1T4YEZ2_9BACT|nr:hypothetical protein SAMN02745166_03032 [Prosthecobacter debontii]